MTKVTTTDDGDMEFRIPIDEQFLGRMRMHLQDGLLKFTPPKREIGPVQFTRFQHVISAVYGEPWLITPEAHASIRNIVESRMKREDAPTREGQRICGDTIDLESMSIDEDGIAVIPIGGAVARKLTGFEKGGGAVDINDILGELSFSERSDDVRAVILHFDSPGGTVNGTPEAGAAIAAFSKPIAAYTEGLMASAAYWMGSSADAVYASRSASVGSIGTYMAYLDYTERFKQEGIKVEMIKAGDLKGAGFPGTPLSEAQRENFQAQVDGINAQFHAHVRSHRGEVADDTMRGQVFYAPEAMERNLIDGIVTGIDDVKQLLLSSI